MPGLQRFVDVVLTIGDHLDTTEVLKRILPAARELVGARYVALGVLAPDGEFLEEFFHDGLDEQTAGAIGTLPRGHGLLGLLIRDPEPIRVRDVATHPAAHGFPEHHPPMRSFLGVPIRIGSRVFGNLYMTEKIGGVEFTQEDEEVAAALASIAGMVIENARMYEDVTAKAERLEAANREIERLAVVTDRERIGRELHDTVVQRIFSSGLALQALARSCADEQPEAAARINEVIDELDETIRQIRTAIFSLHGSDGESPRLRASLAGVVAEAARLLGFEPTMTFEGPVDTLATRDVTEHAVAVLREALTNVLRHADASRVGIHVRVGDSQFELSVIDDGRGLSKQAAGGRGLLNMRQRARALDGSFSIEQGAGGTTVTWRVPLS